MKIGVKYLARAAVIAALYSALVILSSLTPYGALNFGQVQLRFSEALTVLPYFTPAAVPGLFIGCLVSNIAGSAMGVGLGLPDIVLGSLATLAAAWCSCLLRKCKWLVPLPPVLFNAVAVGFILNIGLKLPLFASMLLVGAGEAVACYGLGLPLLLLLEKRRNIFK